MLIVFLITLYSNSSQKTKNKIKSEAFLSPEIELGAGSVVNKFYFDVNFPRGHIALKSFNVEVIDEAGNHIPLQEIYIHHWVLIKYHKPKHNNGHHQVSLRRNSGLCQGNIQGQYFGLGSETGGTDLEIPDPFGIEVGNPKEIPDGYEEAWILNIHAIDTRGVEDKLGCIECKCNLYNVTKDENGYPLRPNYQGGLKCCYDNTQCKLKKGFEGPRRRFYLKYTVKWVDWDDYAMPLKIYVFDITDNVQMPYGYGSKEMSSNHDCRSEYDVEACNTAYKEGSDCIDVKKTYLPMESGGYVIYGVAHQHSGGIGSALYGQDGRIMCSSIPRYGEEGYVVGMSTCYPEPGSMKIMDGEILTFESNYSNTRGHTGVMGLFYLLVAEQLPHQHKKHSSRA
ncbi:stress up-regulated Nod 19 protein [Senna tora]|uniref:Stress up-regulated Nod 19 protein n=1 Tax=Senna tora TaxID=362788 RepID=A0A834X2Y3_9FABA|nr:stress up-regulated Nod 19 protein [Senna tora]